MNLPGSRDHDAALTAEERALADRIAATSLQREPSPALDASILAAAQADLAPPVAAPTAPPRPQARARRRWPAALGIAATLVLAVGIAWQLRPPEQQHVEYSEAPRMVSQVNAVPSDVQPVAAISPPEPAAKAAALPPPKPASLPTPTPAPPAEPESMAATGRTQEPQPRLDAAPPPAQATAARIQAKQAAEAAQAKREQAAIVFDAPAPMDTPAPTPAAPPPAPMAAPRPPAAAGAAPSATAQALPTLQAISNPATSSPATASEAAAARRSMKAATASGIRAIEQGHGAATGNAATEDRSLERRVSDRSETDDARVDRFGDQPLDDEPPATADSPAVQQAWLKRVRELLAKGRHDAARDSLREYQRRYPNAALPDDLRDLLAQ